MSAFRNEAVYSLPILARNQSLQEWVIKTRAEQLVNQGDQQYKNGKYEAAINIYKQVLIIFYQINDRKGIGLTYSRLGRTYYKLNKKYRDGRDAIIAYKEAIKIFQELGEKTLEANQLNNLGITYDSLGRYPAALSAYNKALIIFKQLNNLVELGKILDNMSYTYYNLGKYADALKKYEAVLEIRRTLKDKRGEGITLQGIGNIYLELGRYSDSLEYYQQSVVALKNINEPELQGFSVSGIGYVYAQQGLHTKALEFYQQALTLYRQAVSSQEEGHTLNAMGDAYLALQNCEKSFDLLNQALQISRVIGDRQYEGRNLNSLGNFYKVKNNFSKSLELYQQALAISQEIGDRTSERITLSAIGDLLTQRKPELAIIFYKQAVNVTESIRRDIQTLPREHQESYTQTVANTYRQLADLLLKQGRVLEAQKVLDLLKIQELQDYLHNVRGSQESIRGIENLPLEQQILEKYGEIQKRAIEIGKELTQLHQIPDEKRTPAQQQRIEKLSYIEQDINKQFNQFIESREVNTLLGKLNQATRRQNLDLADLTDTRNELAQIPNAVLLYPFIAEDRLELILTTPDTPPLRRTVKVTRSELNQAIAEFRNKVENKDIDVKSIAHKLYNWLIKPLESDLEAADAKTIIYAPDAQLRYLPLAALYDGKQWLVERFAVNSIRANL
ncbi:tetratricopeptide repeat protein [Nostoc sp. DSM 114160]